MSSKLTSIITNLGIIILITYCITQLLNFYGIGINIYGTYLSFYAFLLLSSYVLPKSTSLFS